MIWKESQTHRCFVNSNFLYPSAVVWVRRQCSLNLHELVGLTPWMQCGGAVEPWERWNLMEVTYVTVVLTLRGNKTFPMGTWNSYWELSQKGSNMIPHSHSFLDVSMISSLNYSICTFSFPNCESNKALWFKVLATLAPHCHGERLSYYIIRLHLHQPSMPALAKTWLTFRNIINIFLYAE